MILVLDDGEEAKLATVATALNPSSGSQLAAASSSSSSSAQHVDSTKRGQAYESDGERGEKRKHTSKKGRKLRKQTNASDSEQ